MKSNFTAEINKFIKNNVIGRTSKELTYQVNRKFNLNLTIKQVQQYKKKYKLKSGIDTRFKKGQNPYNKKPKGSEFVTVDGYTMIKIDETNTWQLKHRYIWESINGKIKDGYSVIFADGNKRNFDIDNLILVEVKDKLVAKNKHLIFETKELTKIGVLIAKLINAISQKKRCKNEK